MGPGGNGERTSCSLAIVCVLQVLQTLEQDKIWGIRTAEERGEEQSGGGALIDD